MKLPFFLLLPGDNEMIRVQKEDFDVGAELQRLESKSTAIGGVCSFVGLVRGERKGDGASKMTLEHYPGMTEKALGEIVEEAQKRWPLEDALIIHRYGSLKPGDRIVMVATASAHRQAAFDGCQFLIDWLKTKAPFWKLEETNGESQWVEARNLDDQAAERWNKSDERV
jgi:molybdopterin synthase catalytic subunit